MHGSLVSQVIAVVALLLIAALAAILLRRLRLPYTVGLVAVGVGLGVLAGEIEAISVLKTIELSPEIILFIFLPTLIFESAFNLDFRLLSKNLLPVLVLAAPGLLLSTILVGGLVAWATPLAWGAALLFGALISATDPVAVVALFKELGAPRRLAILVEGESLFNDATAIVLFQIILATTAGGAVGAALLVTGLTSFVTVFAGGLLVGLIIGYLMVRFIGLVEEEPLVEVALSTVVAYTAFIAADHFLHVSGVMSTVGAGLVVGTLGSTRFSKAVRTYLHHFWEYAGYVANSFIFLLVGLSVELAEIWYSGVWILITIMIVLLVRAMVVFTLVPVSARLPGAEPIEWKYQVVLFWGGLRGAVALALAFSLPHDFASRELVLALAFGVVLFSILGGGLTMKPLISQLGLDRPSLLERMAQAQAGILAKQEALKRLSRLQQSGHFSQNQLRQLQSYYQSALDAATDQLQQLRAGCDQEEIKKALWSEALTVQRATYRRLFERGALSEAVLHELMLEVELEHDRLKGGEYPGQTPVVVPLEVRLASLFYGIVGRVLPRSRRAERHRLANLSAKYEHLAAEVEASRRVVEAMNKLEGVDKTQGEDLREIQAAYRQREAEAFKRLDTFCELFPEHVTAVQRRTILRVALDGEADTIAELADHGQIPNSVAQAARQRVEQEQRRMVRRPLMVGEPRPEDLVRRVPLLQHLDGEQVTSLSERLVPQTALAGEAVVKAGERGDSLFLIARGLVAVVVVDGQASRRRIATLHRGDFFGELALLSRGVRTADVVAVSDCQFYRLFRRDLEALARSDPKFKQQLKAVAERRLKELRRVAGIRKSFDEEPLSGLNS